MQQLMAEFREGVGLFGEEEASRDEQSCQKWYTLEEGKGQIRCSIQYVDE